MTSQTFRQEWNGSWPSGSSKAVGLISIESPALEGRGVQFRPGSDELSSFIEAALRLPSGRALLLIRRPNPSPGIEVWADAADDPVAALGELRSTLDLGENEVVWPSPRRP